MKKILIIGLTNKMGGVETFIKNTTIFSNKKKYEYYYLVHGSKNCVFQDEIEKFYKDKKHIFFIDNYKKNPIKCFFQLKKIYKNNKFDLIHLQTGMSSEILYVFPFNFIHKIKVISHSHNGNGKNKIENKIFRPLLRFCTYKFLACSKEAEKWLFGKEIKSIIVNNGINTEKFKYNDKIRKKIREEHNINNELVIGHVGRFTEQKNHEYLIDIFIELLKIKEDSKLILIGTGENYNKIQKKCNEAGIIKKVIFTGVKNNIEDYYSAFDIFVLPSMYEGLPVVGIEAQSNGLTCIFSENIDTQILITRNTELYSISTTPKMWAKKIIEASKIKVDRRKTNEMVVNSGYSIENTVKELEKIYEVDR